MKTILALFLSAASLPAFAQDVTASKVAAPAAPGTHAFFATASLAPAFGLSSNARTQLKLGQSCGYHFGEGASGFALGAEIQESIGGSAFGFAIGPKVWFDIALSEKYGVYLAPSFMMGLAYASVSQTYYGYEYGSTSGVGLDMQIGLEAKMILADRGLIFFRPVTIDIGVGDVVALRYDLVFGGGVMF